MTRTEHSYLVRVWGGCFQSIMIISPNKTENQRAGPAQNDQGEGGPCRISSVWSGREPRTDFQKERGKVNDRSQQSAREKGVPHRSRESKELERRAMKGER